MRTLSWLVVAVCVSSTAAFADEAKSVQAREVAKLVMSEKGWEDIIRASSDAVTIQLQGMFAQTGKKAPADLDKRFEAEMRLLMPYQEMLDLQISLLVKHYTAKELTDLMTFYKSPVGQKMIATMPEIMRDVQGMVMQKVSTGVPGMVQRIMAEDTEAPALRIKK